MTEQDFGEIKSDAHLVKLLKWPIVFFLLFTSVPAGFMPVCLLGTYRTAIHDEHVRTNWKMKIRVKNDWALVHTVIVLSVAALIVQLGMSWLAWWKWKELLLGLRGAGWFALIWTAYTVGFAAGVWIFAVAPE
jgi:hypothetical protein